MGGFTLGDGYGGGLGGLLGGNAGGTCGGAWVSVLCYRLGSCSVVHMCLVGWGGFGGALVAANIFASCRIASMV